MTREELATSIFLAAISEKRCAELLNNLFEGGSATVTLDSGKLLLAPRSVFHRSECKGCDCR